jgi:hypothetical protein
MAANRAGRVATLTVLVLMASAGLRDARGDGYDMLPERVGVLPVAFVPRDQAPPQVAQEGVFLKHLAWARRRYGELLNKHTFQFATAPARSAPKSKTSKSSKSSGIADSHAAKPSPTFTDSPPTRLKVVRGKFPLETYCSDEDQGAMRIVAEILDHFDLDRFSNAYVFAILFMNAKDRRPLGAGTPLNGGTNGGGGMFFIASGELVRNEHFQTTLQHELGHAFGLAHPDQYGYKMDDNPSLMSYNPRHFTKAFLPSPAPGSFIPEDLRALALNDRAFADTRFVRERDVPADYKLHPYLMPLLPRSIPGHPEFYPTAKSPAGEEMGSKAERCLFGYIRPSEGPGVTYDPLNMWHTHRDLQTPNASLDIEFPFPVEIDGFGVHTQHSALDHEATHVRLTATDATDEETVLDQPLDSIDATLKCRATRARKWRVELTPGRSKTIVVRGLRFLKDGKDVYPRLGPYGPLDDIP